MEPMKHTLVLVRHGESTWNRENRFTGWTDVGLTDAGVAEAREAARLLRAEGFDFDIVHTSYLKRALWTMVHLLEDMERLWLPVRRHWRLNERHYGALQGLNKKETAERYGADQVHQWRRSYDVRPPALVPDDPRHPRHDPRYRDLPPEILPATECLKDVVDRMLPYWYDAIVPDLRTGLRVLVVAHGNSLRALVKHLDGISDAGIPSLNIPTGVPLVYALDGEMLATSRRYLGDPEAVKRAAKAVADQAKR
jgi:2,3-bisphosphoglycerate-dependent phosphoglycerate mutase